MKKGNTDFQIIYIIGGVNLNTSYSLEEIQKNDNLMLNLKNDIIFKNCFLDYNSKSYLIKFLNLVFNLKYNDIFIKNNELASGKIRDKSSFTDLICSKDNIDYIIEMNNSKSNTILEKNMGYLFKQHLRKINKKNNYGKNKYTYLINIDNFDVIKRNNIMYESYINFPKYNISLYKNIKIFHINLVYLKRKLYNMVEDDELTELEKLLLIFIIQEKDKLRKIIQSDEIEGVLKIMDKMKLENDYIATYDRDEFERLLKEEYENNLEQFGKDKEQFGKDKEQFGKDKEKFGKDKEKFGKEKKVIVQEFKKLGLSLKRISELTKLPIDQIKMLL